MGLKRSAALPRQYQQEVTFGEEGRRFWEREERSSDATHTPDFVICVKRRQSKNSIGKEAARGMCRPAPQASKKTTEQKKARQKGVRRRGARRTREHGRPGVVPRVHP